MIRRALVPLCLLLVSSAYGGDNPIERWARAVGGRERIGQINCVLYLIKISCVHKMNGLRSR